MFDKLKELSALKALLTRKNLAYLDITLGILTCAPKNQAYEPFWQEFSKYFPNKEAAKEAWKGLTELHMYVRKELNKPHGN